MIMPSAISSSSAAMVATQVLKAANRAVIRSLDFSFMPLIFGPVRKIIGRDRSFTVPPVFSVSATA